MLVIGFSVMVEMFVRLSADSVANSVALRHSYQPIPCILDSMLLSAYLSNRIHSFRSTIDLAHKLETLAYANGSACVVTPLAGYNRSFERSYSNRLCD